MKKIFVYIFKHKIIVLVILIMLVIGGYFGYKKIFVKADTIRYNTAKVEQRVLISTISGTGQISATSQVDLKTNASGAILKVNAKVGQEVKTGKVLLTINAREAYKSVRDAQANLDSAKLSMTKLEQPATDYSVMQAENSLASARTTLEKLKLSQTTDYLKAEEAKQKAENNLATVYEDIYNTVANSFLDLPGEMTGLYNALFSSGISQTEAVVGSGSSNENALVNTINNNDWEERDKLTAYFIKAKNDYNSTKVIYDLNFDSYKTTSRFSEKSLIENLLNQTVETTKQVANCVKSEINVFDYWVEYRNTRDLSIFSKVTEYQADLGGFMSEVNGNLSSLLAIQTALQTDREAITNAERDLTAMDQNNPLDLAAAEANVKDKEKALENLKAGTDPLDIQAQKMTITQRQNALWDAQEKLADYSVKAPFDGVIAAFTAKKGDSISSGASVGTIITKQRLATIALNEVDIAKIKVGQKANLTFDAVDDLNITGEVVEVDALGTTSQGVVSYNVKIAFDIQDDRIKSGMSVSANIILSTKPDVLLVLSSAVKSSGGASYVEELEANGVLIKKDVEIGDSNDTMTEIVSGLEEGEEIVTQKITVSATNAITASSNKSNPGGDMMRMMR